MAVEQEMTKGDPPDAETLSEFLPETDCTARGFNSCIELAGALSNKTGRQ